MDVFFKSSALATACNKWKKCQKKFGAEYAGLIQQRLREMKAADTLADLMKLPGPDCHPLREDRKGQWAVALIYPYRIVFEPANEPLPKREDGSLDPSQVTAVLILKVKFDYHGGKGRGK